MNPVKAVMVLPSGSEIQMEHYRQVFAEWSVWVTPDDQSLSQVVTDANPDVIISLGTVETSSSLWSMPLWRRRTWLNLPNATMRPEEVFLYAMSLLMSLLEDEAFVDSPLVSLVPFGNDPERIAATVRQITAGQDYDNIEVLIPSNLWNPIRDFLQGHIALMMLRQVPTAVDDAPNSQLRSVMGATRGTLIWPVTTFSESLSPEFLTHIVSTFRSDAVNAIVAGSGIGPASILDSLEEKADWKVRHVLFEQAALIANRRFVETFPAISLGAFLSLLCVEPTTEFMELNDGATVEPEIFKNEPDSSHVKLLRGAIGFARVQLLKRGID